MRGEGSPSSDDAEAEQVLRVPAAPQIQRALRHVEDAWRAARCPDLWELPSEDPAAPATARVTAVRLVYRDRLRALGGATAELARAVQAASRPELDAALAPVLELCGTYLAAVSLHTTALDGESEDVLDAEDRAMVAAAVRAAPDDDLSVRMRAALDAVLRAASEESGACGRRLGQEGTA